MINSGLPLRITYSAYNTDTNQFVAGDSGNHTISLVLNGTDLGAPTNEIIDLGDGVYEIELTEAERTGIDLVIKGTSSTADIVILPVQYSADTRWNELLEDDGSGNLRNTAKSLEQGPDSIADVSGLATSLELAAVQEHGDLTWGTADVSGLATSQSIIDLQTHGDLTWRTADVSELALEESVQLVLTTGGAGPWTTGSGGGGEQDWTDVERNQIRNRLGIDGASEVPATTPTLALQESVLGIKGVTDKLTFNGSDILRVDVQWWQGQDLSGLNMIQDFATTPKWTISALSLAPAGGGGGSVSYVSRILEDEDGYLDIMRGDTLRLPILLDMSLVSATEITFAIKKDTNDLDEEALVFISSLGGLLYINGEVADTPGNGTLTVDSSATGVILVTLAAAEAAKLPERYKRSLSEVQIKTASSIYTAWRQKTTITGDVVRTTA